MSILNSDKSNMKIKESIRRINQETELKTQEEIAKVAEINRSAISQRIRRGQEFNGDWAYKIGKKYNLTTEWIMTGKEPKHPVEDKYLIQLNQWMGEIDESKREEVRGKINEALPEFINWLINQAGDRTKKDNTHQK